MLVPHERSPLLNGKRVLTPSRVAASIATWARTGHNLAIETQPPEPDVAFGNATEFKRDLGFVPAVSIVIGTVIDSGIFIAPSLVLKQVGSPSLALLVWLVTGVCALFGALCYAELASMMPRSGGPFVYLRKAFPPWVPSCSDGPRSS